MNGLCLPTLNNNTFSRSKPVTNPPQFMNSGYIQGKLYIGVLYLSFTTSDDCVIFFNPFKGSIRIYMSASHGEYNAYHRLLYKDADGLLYENETFIGAPIRFWSLNGPWYTGTSYGGANSNTLWETNNEVQRNDTSKNNLSLKYAWNILKQPYRDFYPWVRQLNIARQDGYIYVPEGGYSVSPGMYTNEDMIMLCLDIGKEYTYNITIMMAVG